MKMAGAGLAKRMKVVGVVKDFNFESLKQNPFCCSTAPSRPIDQYPAGREHLPVRFIGQQ